MTFGNEPDKDAGLSPANDAEEQFETKTPAVMKLASGALIEVDDWFYDAQGRVCCYFSDRKSGIDARFRDEHVVMIFRSRATAAAALHMSEEELRQEVQDSW